MIDGTPVLDIKPFIQAYDNPRQKFKKYIIYFLDYYQIFVKYFSL